MAWVAGLGRAARVDGGEDREAEQERQDELEEEGARNAVPAVARSSVPEGMRSKGLASGVELLSSKFESISVHRASGKTRIFIDRLTREI